MSLSRKIAAVAAGVAAMGFVVAGPALASSAMKNMQDKASAMSGGMAMAHQEKVATKSSTTTFAHGLANAKAAAQGPNHLQ